MSSEPALIVEGLGKRYDVFETPAARMIHLLRGGTCGHEQGFWALRDISFSAQRGETVGIIGRNGSGKSTLLQLIAGTLTPTAGTSRRTGSIAALLELGAGFDPEFSGRENLLINAAILGFSQQETEERASSIIEFAELEPFIDRPIKTYSSGMVMRLAFSIAISADPEILIVDEALAVGDERFQRKCFARIESLKSKGTTILFVSHSAGTILELCDRAILLDDGELIHEGSPKATIGLYQKLLYAPADERPGIRQQIKAGCETPTVPSQADSAAVKKDSSLSEEWYDPSLLSTSMLAYEQNGAVIEHARITTRTGRPVNILATGQDYLFEYRITFHRRAERVRYGMMIRSLGGTELGGIASENAQQNNSLDVQPGTVLEVTIAFTCNLNSGTYYLNAGVTGQTGEESVYLHRVLDIALFKVAPRAANRETAPLFLGGSTRHRLLEVEQGG